MYFRKCWRDARLSVLIYLVPIVLYIWSVVRHPGSSGTNGNPSSLSVNSSATVLVSFVGSLLLFVAWSLGGEGIGHEIADDRGAYLLTRPRSRQYFSWCDNGFAFGLMSVLAWSTVFLVVGLAQGGLVNLPNRQMPSPLFFIAVPLCGLVFAGLIYAVTYLCTALIPRDKTARAVSLAVLLGVAYLRFKASHQWTGWGRSLFPSWWVNPYPDKASNALAPHLWLQLGARALVILLVLAAAQVVLDRREIRA